MTARSLHSNAKNRAVIDRAYSLRSINDVDRISTFALVPGFGAAAVHMGHPDRDRIARSDDQRIQWNGNIPPNPESYVSRQRFRRYRPVLPDGSSRPRHEAREHPRI